MMWSSSWTPTPSSSAEPSRAARRLAGGLATGSGRSSRATTLDIHEARDLGDVVLLIATHHGRGRSSGAEVHGETGYLYTVRDGKIVRVELHPSGAAALDAAGVRD
jgi:hypothetical protein